MSNTPDAWGEVESAAYRRLARYAVPERERQTAIVVALVVAADVAGDVLDLCCGEGLLSEALLRAVPRATLHAYDGSAGMLALTEARAGASGRLVTRPIDLAARDWRRFERPLRAVVSSLAVHHLDAAAKGALFADLRAALAPGGVFVLADVVRPATPIGRSLAADLWDEEVERRALALDGNLDGLKAFRQADWNHFRHTEPDPIDEPSTVVEHLDWLRAAGFVGVDLHWMTAGHAILSGWKP